MWPLPHALSVLVMLVSFKATHCKRADFWQTKKVVLSCDRNGRVALVEHFFSIIFTEFRKNPPVCVCVQMCENQATYCYPNGCLLVKTNEGSSSQTMHTPGTDYSDNQQMTTRDDPRQSTMPAINQHSALPVGHTKPAIEEGIPRDNKDNGFEENHKRIFKSKFSHKVGLRFVAETPNYVKSGYQGPGTFEQLDMAKTHWPAPQAKPAETTKPPVELMEEPNKIKKFFLPTFNEEPDADSLSQNFKRNTLLSASDTEDSKEDSSIST